MVTSFRFTSFTLRIVFNSPIVKPFRLTRLAGGSYKPIHCLYDLKVVYKRACSVMSQSIPRVPPPPPPGNHWPNFQKGFKSPRANFQKRVKPTHPPGGGEFLVKSPVQGKFDWSNHYLPTSNNHLTLRFQKEWFSLCNGKAF